MVAVLSFPPALMSRDQAAYYLSMSTRELDRLRQTGELIPRSSGKNVRYTKAELDAYIDRLPERVSTPD